MTGQQVSLAIPTRDGKPMAVSYWLDDLRSPRGLEFIDSTGRKHDLKDIDLLVEDDYRSYTLPFEVAVAARYPLALITTIVMATGFMGEIDLPAGVAQECGLVDASAAVWFERVSFRVDRGARVYRTITPTTCSEEVYNMTHDDGLSAEMGLPTRDGPQTMSKQELDALRLRCIDPSEVWYSKDQQLMRMFTRLPLADGWQVGVLESFLVGPGELVFEGPRGTFGEQYALIEQYMEHRTRVASAMTLNAFQGFVFSVTASKRSAARPDWTSKITVNWLKWSTSVERLVALVLATRSAQVPTYCLLWIVEWLPFGRVTPHGRLIAFIEQVIESVKRIELRRVKKDRSRPPERFARLEWPRSEPPRRTRNDARRVNKFGQR